MTDEWQNINSAPKDGTEFVGLDTGENTTERVRWEDDDCGGGFYSIEGDQLSHADRWKPI